MVLMATQGLSPGAALVFLITGPATNAATIGTIWKVMGRRTAVVYVIAVAIMAIAAGLAMDAAYSALHITWQPTHDMNPMNMQTNWLGVICAVVLLVMLLPSLVVPLITRLRGRIASPVAIPQASQMTLAVEGMTCTHCQATVTRILKEVPGVRAAVVDLKGRQAFVEGEGLSAEKLCAAINELGTYTARPQEKRL